MYNHNEAQQSKNRVHISWDILYGLPYNFTYLFLLIFYIIHFKNNEPEQKRAVFGSL